MPHATDEVTIRAPDAADADALHRVYSGPQAIRGTLQIPFPPAKLWRDRLENPSDQRWQLVACTGDEIVGHLSLVAFLDRPRRKHAATIGMVVADEWRGRGVGTKLMEAILDLADNWLDLRRIELEVFVDNEPAIRLYEKFGFVHEGTLRQFAFRDGEFVDVYAMARIRAADGNPPAAE